MSNTMNAAHEPATDAVLPPSLDRSNEIAQRIESELKAMGKDCYLVLSREDSDPVLARIIDMHVVALTAVLFRADGQHLVLTGRTDVAAYAKFPFFARRIAMEQEFVVEFSTLMNELQPKSLLLNISEDRSEYDGLRWGLYQQLIDAMGSEELSAMSESSAELLDRVLV